MKGPKCRSCTLVHITNDCLSQYRIGGKDGVLSVTFCFAFDCVFAILETFTINYCYKLLENDKKPKKVHTLF